MKRIAVLLLTLGLSAPAWSYTALGIGTDTCEWVVHLAKRGSTRPEVIQPGHSEWALGYITAANLLNEGAKLGWNDIEVERVDIMAWLRGYCEENPKDFFEKAVWELILELRGPVEAPAS